MDSKSWDADALRTRFTQALSDMYRGEVPLYGKLVQIVHDVDNSVLLKEGKSLEDLPIRHQLERHGAIRLGTNEELRNIKRLFGIMGMHPVGYYDLRMVGFPLHGTAFRPLSEESLQKNPFRVFTTVLRADLLSEPVRRMAKAMLSKRCLFSPRLKVIMDQAEKNNHLTDEEGEALINEALAIFRWHSRATVSLADYLQLKQEHPVVADIVCFPSAHINHLTPRTLDIDLVQREMLRQGLPAKDVIEGPPSRQCPILLRQTSFKALEEQVNFTSAEGHIVPGTHTARFGEVEQRGAAVTRKGRELYDELLVTTHRQASESSNPNVFGDIFEKVFRNRYPDDWVSLRRCGLVCFRYRVTAAGQQYAAENAAPERPLQVEKLLELGLLEYEPVTYEDFLPLSAAGIFKSNLRDEPSATKIDESGSALAELEAVLGGKIPNEIDLYEDMQARSIRECERVLGCKEISLE